MLDNLRRYYRMSLLLLGDILVFLLFSLFGKIQHQLEVTSYSVLYTAFPFIFGWLLIIIWSTKLENSNLHQLHYLFSQASRTWLLAGPLALLLRMIIEGRVTNLTFIVVTLGTVYLFLLGWRFLFYAGHQLFKR